ncbi:amino acid ABC transporter permease [Gryllotalpicola kribbensis]|uniref:amino acid ABC transporter permease n=1 Tax=Gryllotalpicola kribbensis TaxID=993084 RepID=UPI0031DF2A89
MDAVFGNLPGYAQGFGQTLLLFVVSGVAALILGTIIAMLRISPVASARGFATVYTELIRNVPLPLVFAFCAFVLPYLGSRLPYLVAAFLALAVYTSPFIAEALRSGVNGVPVGQAEAARSLGLGFGQTVGLIILPQAFRTTVPPVLNVLIALVKNTSVASGFFVAELLTFGKQLANARGDAVIPVLLGIAVCYLVITVPLGLVAGRLEKKWAIRR